MRVNTESVALWGVTTKHWNTRSKRHANGDAERELTDARESGIGCARIEAATERQMAQEHVLRGSDVENAVAGTQHGALVTRDIPSQAEPWSPVVVIRLI